MLASVLLAIGTVLVVALSLLAYREPAASARGIQLPLRLIRLLQGAPILVVLILIGFFLTVLKDQQLLRIGHAFLVLGLWMNGTLALVYTIRHLKAHGAPPALPAATVVLTIPAAIYLTSYDHHQAVFNGSIVPLLAGILLVGVAYRCLQTLSQSATA